ncbi:MAG: membrane-bound lytic murein transglycosylase MltF, partial [Thiohalospira sp.]
MVVAGLFAALAGCDGFPGSSSELAPVHESGELVVATRNAPTIYYVDRHDRPAGFEYDLVRAFADTLGVELRLELRHTIGEVKQALRNGEAHMAAAGLTRAAFREEEFRFGPDYKEVRQQLVCRRNGPQPAGLHELGAVSLLIVDESSYADRLKHLQSVLLPDLEWRVDSSLTTEVALQRVHEGVVDCTVADSNIVRVNRRYHPELDVVMPLNEPQQLAWMLPRDSAELAADLAAWFLWARESGLLEELKTRYYAHVEIFDYVDTSRFLSRIDERLPRYRALFERAGERYGIDWMLLAAQGYQESHWEPRARSPTGVRGIMMLTRTTAAELGIRNRLDPEQSITGGARYLARLRERVPEEVEEPDRTWFALAAYNIGMSHIYDARRLARH